MAEVVIMEEICEQIREGNNDRSFYKDNLVKIKNLARREWIEPAESPLIVAVQCNRLELVELFIYLGIHVNSIQHCGSQTKTALNEALRCGYRNIVELLLKKGASLDLSEKSEDGQEIFPMELAKKNSTLLSALNRVTRKISTSSHSL